MTKCGSWKKYKGIRSPSCLGGKGCDLCWEIWISKNTSEKPRKKRV